MTKNTWLQEQVNAASKVMGNKSEPRREMLQAGTMIVTGSPSVQSKPLPQIGKKA